MRGTQSCTGLNMRRAVVFRAVSVVKAASLLRSMYGPFHAPHPCILFQTIKFQLLLAKMSRIECADAEKVKVTKFDLRKIKDWKNSPSGQESPSLISRLICP